MTSTPRRQHSGAAVHPGQHQVEVRVQLLGAFAVTVDGATIPAEAWSRRAAASLVKLLALQPDRRLIRDRVIDALWPDLLVVDAAPRLHKATHYARSVLGMPDAIVSQGPALALWPEANLVVDAHDFELAADTARGDASPELARAAATLYTGELLPDDLYEPWTEAARSRLRLRWLELLPAAGMYEELVNADPLDEEAHLALVRHHVAAGHRQAALGALERMAEVLERELGVAAGPEADELRRAAEALPVPAVADGAIGRARRLPALRSRLIGRDSDLGELRDLMERHRIVTITGPGGAGKSTLAIAVAHAATGPDQLATDAVLAELATARDAYSAVRVVAEAAGIEGDGAIDAASLAAILARRGTLLVLDNCEHLLDASADLVDALLDAGPDTRVLATSREPLGVSSEVEYRLGSLGNHSAELFVERANAVRAGSAVVADPQVADLCAHLDGLPLAIELAAAQLRHLSLSDLVGRLDDRLRLLSGGRPRAGDRHSALSATIDWSYRLLDESSRALFDQLGMFPASFDLDAAGTVAARDPRAVEAQMGDLVAKSLVVFDPIRGRYRLLETVRLFAIDRLNVSGNADRVAERLRQHVLGRARAESRPRSWLSTDLAARCRDDIDNVRWAFNASLARGDTTDAVDLAIGLSTLWRNATSYAEGRLWVAELLARDLDPRDRVWARILAADVGLGSGDIGAMREHSDGAAALEVDDPAAATIAGIYQAMVHLAIPEVAVARLEQLATRAAAASEPGLERLARGYGLVARLLSGRPDELSIDELTIDADAVTEQAAHPDYALYLARWAASLVALVNRDSTRQAQLIARQIEDLKATGLDENWLTVYWRSLTLICNGDDYAAQLGQARAWAQAEGRSADADCVLALAYAAACGDDWNRAAELVGASDGSLLHDTAGYIQLAIIRDRLIRPHLDTEQFEAAVARGRQLDIGGVLAAHGI